MTFIRGCVELEDGKQKEKDVGAFEKRRYRKTLEILRCDNMINE